MPRNAAPRRGVADLDLLVHPLRRTSNARRANAPFWRLLLDHTIHYNAILRSPFAVPTVVISSRGSDRREAR